MFARRMALAGAARRGFASASGRTLKKSLADLDLSQYAGKTVLVRVDFNAPVRDGKVTDDTRLRASLPTIKALQDANARVVLASHAGQPKGKPDPAFSLRPMADRLNELLTGNGQNQGSNSFSAVVQLAPDCVGPETAELISSAGPTVKGSENSNSGSFGPQNPVILLENVRFHAGETKNTPEFVDQILETVQPALYVNDAFGTAHRAHASTQGVPAKLKTITPATPTPGTGPGQHPGVARVPCVAGLLMHDELRYLYTALEAPERPFTAVVGGSKVSTKLPVLRSLLPRVDRLLVGGAMAWTFLRARGVVVAASKVEPELIEEAGKLLEEFGDKILLPEDAVIADVFEEDSPTKIRGVLECAEDFGVALDIGPDTVREFTGVIGSSATVLWNGTLGVHEWDSFGHGTRAIAQALQTKDRQPPHALPKTSIVGGGDTVSALHQFGLAEGVSHVSTGGGAMLELLEGLELPGVAVLDDLDDLEVSAKQ